MKPTAQVLKAIRESTLHLFKEDERTRPISKLEVARIFEDIAKNLARQLAKEHYQETRHEEFLTKLQAEFTDPNS